MGQIYREGREMGDFRIKGAESVHTHCSVTQSHPSILLTQHGAPTAARDCCDARMVKILQPSDRLFVKELKAAPLRQHLWERRLCLSLYQAETRDDSAWVKLWLVNNRPGQNVVFTL